MFSPQAPPQVPAWPIDFIVMMSPSFKSLSGLEESFKKYETFMGQPFQIERVIMGLVYSFRCKLKVFALIEVYGENASWALREFVAAIPGVATGQNWKQG